MGQVVLFSLGAATVSRCLLIRDARGVTEGTDGGVFGPKGGALAVLSAGFFCLGGSRLN